MTPEELDTAILAMVEKHPGWDQIDLVDAFDGEEPMSLPGLIRASCARLLRAGKISSRGPYRAVKP